MLKPITQESADRICALVIGKAGIGKTSLLRTITNGSGEKTCVLSAESGLLAVRDLVKAGSIEGFEIFSLKDFKEAYDMLASKEEMKKRYDWIFIDSLTEISSRCVEAMKAKYPSNSDSFKLWGDYTDTMTAMIKGFRDLQDYSVVFTCLPTVEKDENNRRFTGAAVAGSQLKERLASYFDEVFYMEAHKDDEGNEYRIFVTQPSDTIPAKDRSGKLNPVEKPDLNAIKHKIMEE